MNRNIVWSVFAAAIYWLSVGAVGTDWTRNGVAGLAIIIAMATFLRYLPIAWDKYRTNQTAGEWRMLMGLELFWLGFAARETWLLAIRMDGRPQWMVDSPINGFFAFWILCAGLLCFSARDEDITRVPHQNGYIIAASALLGLLVGMLLYRSLWG